MTCRFFYDYAATRKENIMGKKHRNRINSPKKNNHIPKEAIIAEQEAHGKENRATGGRKNNSGH
jgi:hypothetical protein